jgi:hypothetical protein
MAVHRRRRVAAITAAGALALAACGGGGDDETAAEQFEDVLGELDETDQSIDDETFGEDAQAEAKEPELTPVELDLPRETTYAHATWTVDEVTHQSAGVDEFGVETPPAAVVGITVANTGEDAADLPMLADRLWLLDGDGFAIAAEMGTGGEGDTLAAGGQSSFEVVFPLETGIEATDLEGYSFQVGVEGVVPATVPLSGELPEPAYPLTLTMPDSVDGFILSNADHANGGSATLRAIKATVVLDHLDRRAEEGTRILRIDTEIHINEGTESYINQDDLNVSIDGILAERIDSETPAATADLTAGTTTSGTWVFVIPADGKDGVLDFGSYTDAATKGGTFTLPELP